MIISQKTFLLLILNYVEMKQNHPLRNISFSSSLPKVYLFLLSYYPYIYYTFYPEGQGMLKLESYLERAREPQYPVGPESMDAETWESWSMRAVSLQKHEREHGKKT